MESEENELTKEANPGLSAHQSAKNDSAGKKDSNNDESSILKSRLSPFIREIAKRKALNITAIDVRELTSYADVIVVVTASSQRQAASIAEHLYTEMKKTGNMPLGVEGLKEGNWALLDFGDIIIHIFNKETCDFYNIEGLWSDAPRLELLDIAEA
ncbi:ribosome silencing factor [Desulfamplus magnetovallimortis]|nr:ribosome silencing factor [Desulfamplus magnetovallimortis]